MDRENCCGHLRPFLKGACALLLFVMAIPSVKAEISTARCAWTTDEGDQGGTRCAKGPGPASPHITYRRLFGSGIYYGPGFAGIDPDDRPVVTRSSLREGCNVLFLALDGHTEHYLWANDGSTAAGAIDDERFYSGIMEPDKEMLLHCRTFEGHEIWNALCIDGRLIPVNGRGLAVVGPWFGRDLMQFFDSEGQLVSETSLRIPGADSCTVRGPAFDSHGVAVWEATTFEGSGSGSHHFVASEMHTDFVEFCSSYSWPWMPYGACPFVKVNALDNVLVHAAGKLVLYEDVTLENVLWEHHIAGSGTWEEACGDPMGGWWVVHAVGEEDGTDRVMLQRINPDGSLGANNVIDHRDRTTEYNPICDTEGNVYSHTWNYVKSYAPDGALRWRIRVCDTNVRLRAIDSLGTIYVTQTVSRPTYLYAISDGEPHHPRVRVKLPERPAGNVYSAGDELIVLLQPYNFGEDEAVDAYLAVIAPNGAVAYYTSSGWSDSPTPWFSDIFMPNSFEMIDAPHSLGLIPESAPEGAYTIIAGFCQPGTLTSVDELFPITFQIEGD
ncbi:hypothetical protein J7M28_04405 [bacterium]|nr:hypothetical protein [bacterium]